MFLTDDFKHNVMEKFFFVKLNIHQCDLIIRCVNLLFIIINEIDNLIIFFSFFKLINLD